MRRTVTIDEDVEAAVEQLRRERGMGLSEALNELARKGLGRRSAQPRFEQHTRPMAEKLDLTNVAEALELLDGPADR